MRAMTAAAPLPPGAWRWLARAACLAAAAWLLVAPPAHAVRAYTASPGQFVAVSPTRILDTRASAPLTSAAEKLVTVPGSYGATVIPSTATAVAVNVTATDETAPGYLVLWPDGDVRPVASNLNWAPYQTVANLAEVGLGPGGSIRLLVSAGSADIVLDVAGYYVPTGSGGVAGGGQFRPLTPARIMDTRSGLGGTSHALAGGSPVTLQVSGAGNVPADASAVVLNLTEVNGSAASYLSVYPAASGPPGSSNLNFAPGTVRANRVIVRLDGAGRVGILNSAGSVDVVVDVGGYFTPASAPAAGGYFNALTPTRILDTRSSVGGHLGPVQPGETVTLPAAASTGAGVGAVVLNVTTTDVGGGSYLALRPTGNVQTLTSDVNFTAGQTTPNLVVVRVGTDGGVLLYNAASAANVIVDLVGWYTAGPALGVLPAAPAGVSVVAGDRSTTVSWTPPASTGGSSVVSYYISATPGTTWTVTDGSSTQAVLTGLTNTVTYQVSVVAVNGLGSGPGTASVAVTPVGTPDPPTGLVATTPDYDTAVLCWTAPANNGGAAITSYLITMYPTGQLFQVTPTCATFTGQNRGIPIWFAVQAVNSYGPGPAATSAAVVPPSSQQHHIVVSLAQQHMWVYLGTTLISQSDVTTGRPELPTPPGEYHIFYKTSPYEMISPWPYGSPYWYPDAWVNWVLEFKEGGYFLHDAPWRTWFGPGSQYGDGTHGCVNVPTPEMQWLYSWAQVGDWVTITAG